MRLNHWLVIFLSVNSAFLSGQKSPYIVVQDVFFVGNQKTKQQIIQRELSFQKGDTLLVEDTAAAFLQDKNKVFNTGLFHRVQIKVNYKNNKEISIIVWVVERWYLFPIPVFELADRNFNEWWNDRDRDFGRVVWGLKLYHRNFRGRNERLKLITQFGFIQTYQLKYDIPYINQSYNTGLGFNVSYSQSNSVAFNLDENKLDFVSDEELVTEQYKASVNIKRRVGFYQFHTASIGYEQVAVQDTVLRLNNDYFPNQSLTQQYIKLSYNFTYDRRDVQFYPLNGFFLRLEVEKKGLGLYSDLNQWIFNARYSAFKDLNKGFYGALSTGVSLKTKTTSFLNNRGLGYGSNLVRGYELNVINGQHTFLTKTELKKRLFKRMDHLSFPWSPIKDLRYIPFGLYFKTFWDNGYVADNQDSIGNQLANRWLSGGGIGVDITGIFDAVFSLEYSASREQKGNLFIKFSAGIR
ncbi:MAG: BamA/TamA family outer membrane protein [Cyclobacteriaceae bacterium]